MTEKKGRRSWSPEEKKRLANEALIRRHRGESWRSIGEALDVQPWTLQRWTQRRPDKGVAELQEVKVVEDQEAQWPVASSSLSVVCPDGFRFEGIDLETALWLWRALR